MDAATIGAICVLAVVLTIPLIIYVSMMFRWWFDKRLRNWLKLPVIFQPKQKKEENGETEEEEEEKEENFQSKEDAVKNNELVTDTQALLKAGENPQPAVTAAAQEALLRKKMLKERKNSLLPSAAYRSGMHVKKDSKPFEPVLISFTNVTFTVKNNTSDSAAGSMDKKILDNVSAYFAPRSLSAILGPSGCGKTTLLQILSGTMPVGDNLVVEGDVRVNGSVKSASFRRLAAFVEQFDQLMERLTVRETLWFTAELRLDLSLTEEERFNVIERLMIDVDLKRFADVLIGNLSGGTKRRVTVAIELVSKPSLIFLDEPTSGLDSGATLSLVTMLRRLADNGRTVVCTIHQPRQDAFAQFDKVLLLAKGRTFYFGNVSNILTHFKNYLPPPAPPPSGGEVNEEDYNFTSKGEGGDINPADFVLDLTWHTENIDKLIEEFEKSEAKAVLDAEMKAFPTQNSSGVVEEEKLRFSCSIHRIEYATTAWKQSFTLTRRAFVNDVRSTEYMMQWVLGIVMMLFMGMLYCYVVTPQWTPSEFAALNDELNSWGACNLNQSMIGKVLNQTVQQVNGTLNSCGQTMMKDALLTYARTSFLYQMLAGMFFSEMPQVAGVYYDRQIYLREHSSKAYSSNAWIYSWSTKLAFSALLKGLLFPPFVYFSAQLPIYAEPYFLFCIFMGTMSLAGSSVALIVGQMDSLEAASVSFVVVNILAQNLCGYFIYENYIPWYFRWIYFANFFRYCYQGTLLSQQLIPENANLPQNQYSEIQRVAWQYAVIGICYTLLILLVALVVAQRKGRTAASRWKFLCFEYDKVYVEKEKAPPRTRNTSSIAQGFAFVTTGGQ